ncbi:MAG: hypothetical protein QHH02_07475, partial [Syntrophomonadaceae bacterium]|nr:hypothetical protein [Syntrophomonadaceae bacterium]
IDGTADFRPDTLNLESGGEDNAVTVYIELPSEYDVSLISTSTVKLGVYGNTVNDQPTLSAVADWDADGLTELMLKFNRQKVIDTLEGAAGSIAVQVEGMLNGGAGFTASDVVKVVGPKDGGASSLKQSFAFSKK